MSIMPPKHNIAKLRVRRQKQTLAVLMSFHGQPAKSKSACRHRAEKAMPKPSAYREVPEMLRLAQDLCLWYISATSGAAQQLLPLADYD